MQAPERSVLVEVMFDVLKFPWWWYTAGLALILVWCGQVLTGYARLLAITVWIKNLFVPMFGQYDWQSRLISVFMRGVQILGRTVALFGVVVGVALAAVAYLLAPVVVVTLIIYHLTGSSPYGPVT